ncbi:MAG: hypothetical protein WAN36_04625 [Calditrichia bacterium]
MTKDVAKIKIYYDSCHTLSGMFFIFSGSGNADKASEMPVQYLTTNKKFAPGKIPYSTAEKLFLMNHFSFNTLYNRLF